jgi:hypothetical protein
MQVFQTFGIIAQYLNFFFLRLDAWLVVFIAFIGAYSASLIGAFLLLFLGLRDFMGDKIGIVETGFWLLPQMSSAAAVNAGIALLGFSAICSMASTFSAAQTAAGFGVSMVYRFHDRWDKLTSNEKRSILGTAGFATKYARLILVSLMPFSVFVLGIIYLVSYNAFLGVFILTSGIIALFGFVPVNLISRRLTESNFDTNVSADSLIKSKRQLMAYLRSHLEMFVARRFIASVNLLLLFVVVAAAFFILGAEYIVSLFNEQSIVVVVLVRASFLSLTRMTICLRVANTKMDLMRDVLLVLQKSRIPNQDAELSIQDDD